jgi:hypothetical protein
MQMLAARRAGEDHVGRTTKRLSVSFVMSIFLSALFSEYYIRPELGDAKIIDDEGKLRTPKNKITLRQLLTHTAGFGYTFLDQKIYDWVLQKHGGEDEFGGKKAGINTPLLFEVI